MTVAHNASQDNTVSPVSDESFDPYHKWLGIPSGEQPPNHYRLLGIEQYEADADVIESAADRQMAHLKCYATGPRASLSQELLNQLAAARTCLLDPKTKSEYDASLRCEPDQREAVTENEDRQRPWQDGRSPKNLEEFLACLAASRLYSRPNLDDFIANLPPDRRPKDRKALAFEMVQAKKLTKHQAACIYQGCPYHLLFGKYEVIDRIGRGGMGQVYKARHRTMDRLAAVKVISRKSHRSKNALERFRHEVRLAAQLSAHHNIVTTYDAGEEHGEIYLVMEYVVGRDLAKTLKQQGALPIDTAIDVVLQAARGLKFAHSQGIIHQDVKPANLIRLANDTVKVLDLGLASVTGREMNDPQENGTPASSAPARLVGTIDYMSPEQATDQTSAAPTRDIYGLGCTMYHLITGKIPYPAGTKLQKLLAHRNAPIPSIRDNCHDAPPILDDVLARMVAKDASDRFQTMGEVIEALERIKQGEPPAPPIQRPCYPPPSSSVDGDLPYSEVPADGSAVHSCAAAPAPPARGEGHSGKAFAARVPAWAWLVACGGVASLLLTATIFVTWLVIRSSKDGPGLATEQTTGDIASPESANASEEDATPTLVIEPVDDVTVGPGVEVRVPIVIPNRPENCRLTLVSGPEDARIVMQSGQIFVCWMTTAGHADSEHEICIHASHPDYRNTHRTFRICVVASE